LQSSIEATGILWASWKLQENRGVYYIFFEDMGSSWKHLEPH